MPWILFCNDWRISVKRVERVIRKVISAMIYPTVVMVVATSILIGLMIFIVPNFAKIFEEMNLELPAPTKLLYNI